MKKIIIILLLTPLVVLCQAKPKGKDVTFTKEYIKKYNRKYTIESPETIELILTIIAITPTGIADENMINHETGYYKEVINTFKPFDQEPVVKKVDSLISQNILEYFYLTCNSYAYKFKGKKIVPTKVYHILADEIGTYKMEKNNLIELLPLLEEFSQKTSFKNFHKKQLNYYNSIKNDFEKYSPIKKQWDWLESHFSTKHNSYKILFSPLIGGMNCTNSYEDNGFSETLMFLPTVLRSPKWTEHFTEAFNTRVMFSEIDHNYVRKPSNQYEEKINVAFSNRNKWVDTTVYGTQYYPTPVKVFNEYMTFGAFLLYCNDTYSDINTLEKTRKDVESLLTKERGFPMFKEFYIKLEELYNNSSEKNIEDIYPTLLKWCEAEQKDG